MTNLLSVLVNFGHVPEFLVSIEMSEVNRFATMFQITWLLH